MQTLRIERNYYSDERAQMEAAAQREALLSEEERQEELEKERSEFIQQLLDCAQSNKSMFSVLNPNKIKAFRRLSEGAILFAKQNQLNILIEINEINSGTIEFEGELLQTGDGLFPGDKEFLVKLIQTAQQFSLIKKTETFCMEFWFPFYDLISE